MGIVLVLGLAVLVVVVLLVIIGQKNKNMFLSAPVEPMEIEPQLTLEDLKIQYFDMLFDVAHVKFQSGDEQLEFRDKKTHLVVAFVDQTCIVKPVKQQQVQEKKS